MQPEGIVSEPGAEVQIQIQTPLEVVADIAEFANAVAYLLVGHRKILVDGEFDVNLADQMCAALHAKLLGIAELWSFEPEEENPWVEDGNE